MSCSGYPACVPVVPWRERVNLISLLAEVSRRKCSQFRDCRIKPTLVQRLLLELNKHQCDAMFVLLGAVKMRRDRTETEEEVGSKARKGRNITTF